MASSGTPLSRKPIAEAPEADDALTREIMHFGGERLGETLAILVDLLNSERIVIDGFFPAAAPYSRMRKDETIADAPSAPEGSRRVTAAWSPRSIGVVELTTVY